MDAEGTSDAPSGQRRPRGGEPEAAGGAAPAPIYLDHHASTPCAPEVVEAMLPYLSERFANAASASHGPGRVAARAVEEARAQVASLIGASPKEIVFTSGTTESLNLALKGLVAAYPERGRHVVASAVEHDAVLDTCEALARDGVRTTLARVDADGLVSTDAVREALEPDTLAVAVMAANNEIGAVQPIASLGATARDAGAFFVVDAAQAVGKIPFDVRAVGADLVAFSGHKLYGPKGIGALWVRRRPRVRLEPLIHGGGHERGLRSGSLNVPAIVGFGVACALAERLVAEEGARVAALRDRLLAGLQAGFEGLVVNGGMAARLPHNLHVAFPGIEAARLVEAVGGVVALSSGSACASARLEASHVLRAIGRSDDVTYSSIRFGLGRSTTASEIERVIEAVITATEALRR